ncbi:MAG TPA: cobalamin-dependent protein, partial [Dissulfurispiraceae bacterium]
MKILLVEHPRSFSPERCNDIANTPLSSCLLTGYAAGMLCSRGHEVEIVEGFLDRLAYRDIADRARAMEPDIVGLHMVYHWQRDAELFRFAEQVKEESGAFIAAYGFYPTIACEDILGECAAVDAVLLGEPETTFAALAEAVACKQLPRMGEGLAVRNGSGGVVRRPGKLIGDLDALPFPVRTEAFSRIPEVNIQGSRGCYGKCTFCSINPFYGQG